MKITHCGFKRYGRGPYWLKNELGYFIGPVESKREVLVLRLENIGEIKDPYLFSDVADFNGAIRDAEANIDNPWIDWFVDKSWLGVEPIETDDYLFMVGQMN